MPATVIPVTGLKLGPVGAVSHSVRPTITPRLVKSSDTKNLNFGEPAVLNSDNTYSSVAQFIAGSGTLDNTVPLGIAASNTKTNGVFGLSGGQNLSGGYYAPGQVADVLREGVITVKCNVGQPTAGGTVYIRKTANGSIPAGVVGELEASADSTNTVAVTNMKWKTGVLQDGMAEIEILNSTMA